MLLLSIIINMPFRFIFSLCFLVIQFHSTFSSMIMPGTPLDPNPCATCKNAKDGFIEAYKKTAGGNFGGGNTDWEEKNLKGYANSEARLIEIIEQSCSKTASQCSSFLEKYEDEIQEWYQTSSLESLDNFYQWLCFDTAKVCCPEGTFGQNCRRCRYGDNGLVCSGNGDCDGDGTRFGTGQCECDEEYKGIDCSSCQDGYKESIDQDNETICDDIDECRANFFISPCHLYKCKNTDGSYECYGQPFYRELPKMSTLAVLLFTASIFLFKEMYGLASLTLTITSVLLILFAKNLL